MASKQATMASYLAARHITTKMKLHLSGEQLVKPAAIDITRQRRGLEIAVRLTIEQQNPKPKLISQKFGKHWSRGELLDVVAYSFAFLFDLLNNVNIQKTLVFWMYFNNKNSILAY